MVRTGLSVQFSTMGHQRLALQMINLNLMYMHVYEVINQVRTKIQGRKNGDKILQFLLTFAIHRSTLW